MLSKLTDEEVYSALVHLHSLENFCLLYSQLSPLFCGHSSYVQGPLNYKNPLISLYFTAEKTQNDPGNPAHKFIENKLKNEHVGLGNVLGIKEFAHVQTSNISSRNSASQSSCIWKLVFQIKL